MSDCYFLHNHATSFTSHKPPGSVVAVAFAVSFFFSEVAVHSFTVGDLHFTLLLSLLACGLLLM